MTFFFNIIPRLAFTLSGGSYIRTLYLCICLYTILIVREVFHVSVGLQLPLRYNDTAFSFYCQSKSDIVVLYEVFFLQEYLWSEIKNPHVIIDLGAHVGDTALFYHALYPRARIFAVEPDPHSFVLLKRNTKDIAEITPIHAAITKESGTITLHTSKKSSLRTSLVSRSGATKESMVPALSLSDMYETFRITKADLIKFDIEGGEQNMFPKGDPETYAVAYIGEFHGDLITMSPERFISMFSQFNVSMVPMERKGRYKISASIKTQSV